MRPKAMDALSEDRCAGWLQSAPWIVLSTTSPSKPWARGGHRRALGLGHARDWKVVRANGLLDPVVSRDLHVNAWDLAVTCERDRATAVRCLRGHRVDAHDHSDDAAIEEQEGDPLQDLHDKVRDLVRRRPSHGAIF